MFVRTALSCERHMQNKQHVGREKGREQERRYSLKEGKTAVSVRQIDEKWSVMDVCCLAEKSLYLISDDPKEKVQW